MDKIKWNKKMERVIEADAHICVWTLYFYNSNNSINKSNSNKSCNPQVIIIKIIITNFVGI